MDKEDIEIKRSLKPDEKTLLTAFRAFALQNGYFPLQNDLVEMTGFPKRKVVSLEDMLVYRGYLIRSDVQRSYRLKEGTAYVPLLPVYERIPAGNAIGRVLSPPAVTDDYYALRIDDNSMKLSGILTGDIVFIAPDKEPQPNDMVIVETSSNSFLCRMLVLDSDTGEKWLKPSNARYKTQKMESNCFVHGVVCAVYREWKHEIKHLTTDWSNAPYLSREWQMMPVIQALSIRDGFIPSIKKIAQATRVNVMQVHGFITKLDEQGYLRRHENGRIIGAPDRVALVAMVPIWGQIGTIVTENSQESIPYEFAADGNYFAIRADDSMRKMGILSDDILIVRQDAQWQDDDLVIVNCDKTFAWRKGAAGSDASDEEILGVVNAVYRNFA